ncbi:MAG TPA: enoyl-CoA hydratase-related protein [Acidimicrobiia bacterium]|nr:enoyl-CoA hydratase-related protein [Acidimicrobiia bacterium]
MSYDTVPGLLASLDDGLLVLTIDRPEKRNAIDDTVVRAMVAHLEAANNDETVRAILLGSRGDDFCSGFDILGRNADADAPRPRVGSIQRRLPVLSHRVVSLLLSTQVPVVAAVRGWAAGLGLHLALAADFCVVARDARLWEPFATRGFTPDSGGTWLLPRLVGVARAKELLMLGREVSGEEAAAWAIVHAMVAAAEVDAAAATLARRLAHGPTVALGLTKWLVHEGAGLDLERHLANEAFAMELSSRSADFREGMQALRERRDPDFDGR